uniref:EF-hand domain-containing protein n=1 Tax=Arion vulgaris TaxID=1028688 RepID=A0A0B7ADQ1_9EUPU
MFLYAILLVLPALIMTSEAIVIPLTDDELVKQAFDYLDTNRDGIIDRTESEEAFAKGLDANNDGQITIDELAPSVIEHFRKLRTAV